MTESQPPVQTKPKRRRKRDYVQKGTRDLELLRAQEERERMFRAELLAITKGTKRDKT